jgi:hypothetical protein
MFGETVGVATSAARTALGSKALTSYNAHSVDEVPGSHLLFSFELDDAKAERGAPPTRNREVTESLSYYLARGPGHNCY